MGTDLVCRAGGQDELAVGVEGQTVDLCSVGVHCMAGLGRVVGPCVPAETEMSKVNDRGSQTFSHLGPPLPA